MLAVEIIQSLRSLGRQPAFTTVTVLVLALGMGANTAVFSVLHSVLLAPLPYPEPDRLVRLYQVDSTRIGGVWFLPGASFRDYRENLSSLDIASIYAYDEVGVDLMVEGRARRVRILPVSADYFSVLGVEPVIGRTFSRAEELEDARSVLVSDELWRGALSASPDAPGRTLQLDGESWTILGVLPRGFVDPLHSDVDLWVPDDLTVSEYNSWGNNRLTVIGRLAPGVTLDQAKAEVAIRSVRQSEVSTATEREDIGAGLLVPLHTDIAGPTEPMLLAVMAAVSLLLLVTCVNVASLLLARGASREREMAVRTALGSGRMPLVRLMLVECLVLSIAGGALGWLVGNAVQKGLIALAPAALPRELLAGYGVTAGLFGAALSVVVGLALGAVLAWQTSAPRLDGSLHGGTRAGRGISASHTRRALVVTEVALALMLLVGAGLLVRTLDQMRRVQLGFEPENVWTFQANLPDARYEDPLSRTGFHETFEQRLAALPGVTAVGGVSWLPARGNYNPWGARPTGSDQARMGAQHRVVSGNYFEAMEIELIEGRLFNADDGPDSPRRTVVSESIARTLFPQGALGRHIDGILRATLDMEIIGVEEDVALTPDGTPSPVVYLPHAQLASNRNWALTQVVRTTTPFPDLPELAREELARLDPELVLHRPRAMSGVVGEGSARQRFAGTVLGAFALLALLLSSLGVYGVLAYGVAQRRRELGVRLALGAAARDVSGMVVRGGLSLTVIGVALGALGALWLSRLLRSLLFEVSETDPLVFAVAPLVVLATGLVASYLPARRAARVDPAESLRNE
jgi:predicted permease